jgi:hypothetical protein
LPFPGQSRSLCRNIGPAPSFHLSLSLPISSYG